MVHAAALSATLVAPATFGSAFANALNLATVLCIMLTGLVVGWMVGLSHQEARTRISPLLVLLLLASSLSAFQGAAAIGQSLHNPSSTQAYVGARLGFLVLSLICALCAVPGVWLADRWPGRVRVPLPPDPAFRADDAPEPEQKMGHRIERVAALVQPVSDLVRELFTRLYWVAALVLLIALNGEILTIIVWLSSMQRLWHLSPNLYTLVATFGLICNVLGMPVVVLLYLRRSR